MLLLSANGSTEEFLFVVKSGRTHNEYASATAPTLQPPSRVDVEVDGKLVERVYLGTGTHTWWSNNPLIDGPVEGQKILIRLVGEAAMRLEWPCLERVEKTR